MYTRCTTEKATQQQYLFGQTLLDAMLLRPYSEITVSSLCEDSGLSRKTFYRLFSNKDDVLLSLVDHTLMRYMAFHPEERGSIGTLNELHLFFEFWLENRVLLDVLFENNLSTLLLERSIWYVTNEEPGILRHFGANSPETRQEVLIFYVTGIMSLIISWHQTGFRKSVEEMSQIMRHLMLNPPVKP